MRYFNEDFVANSRLHSQWWSEISHQRAFFMNAETAIASQMNTAALLPDDAWRELDDITQRVMRNDEGGAYMADLMPLARTMDIGKLVILDRVSSDAGTVTRSMSGQVPETMDNVDYDFRGNPVPIFTTGYGRNWREWNTQRSENFDALADDQEAHTAKINRDMAQYALTGDSSLVVEGYAATGLRNNALTNVLNLGSAVGGANIDLTTATTDDIEAYFDGPFVQMLDSNYIMEGANIYVSPEIMRRLNKPYSLSVGFKGGTLLEQLESKRYINKIERTFEITGNDFFGFVPNARYVRPVIGMALATVAQVRTQPFDNYQFMIAGAMGIQVRGDFNQRTGVFSATVVNA